MRRSPVVALLLVVSAPLGATAQSSGHNLRAGRMEYTANVQRGDEASTVRSVRTVAQALFQGHPVWRVVDEIAQPGNPSVDTFEVEYRTLFPLRRVATGAGSLSLRYGPAGVAGELRVGPQRIPVVRETGGVVVGDGPGFDLFVAGLPLREGYQLDVRMFGGVQEETRELRLSVMGSRRITTPAGTFDVYVVDVAPADGQAGRRGTLDVMKTAPHYLVRSSAKVPPIREGLPGSSMITQLTKLELAGS